jgi:hypothetical protein
MPLSPGSLTHLQAGLDEAAVDQVRAVLDLLEAGPDALGQTVDVGDGEVADAAFDQAPDGQPGSTSPTFTIRRSTSPMRRWRRITAAWSTQPGRSGP